MAVRSNISWTDATWNPHFGCKKVSEGCKFCYMHRILEGQKKDGNLIFQSPSEIEKPKQWNIIKALTILKPVKIMSKEDKKWKQDFPINRSQSNQVSRRDFAKLLAVVSGGMVLGNGIIAAKAFFPDEKHNDEKQKICTKNDIPIGGTKAFTMKDDPMPYILIHAENGEFYSYEQKCTHLSCAVYYKPGTMKIECPCHNGWFDLETGNVLQGPPPRPLKKLLVTLNGDDIYVQYPKKEEA